jgi:hypothetical protein
MLIVGAVGLRVGMPIFRQHLAIREIERIGGHVDTDARGPTWLRGLVGMEGMKRFDIVTSVDLANTAATDATLSHLACLSELRDIRLTKTQISDVGLANLKGLTNLREVGLYKTQVTDSGLVHLKGLTKLWRLNLGETQVTEEGVGELLSDLPNLNFLDM